MHLQSWIRWCCAFALAGLLLNPLLHAAPPRLMFQKQIPLEQEQDGFRYTIQKGEYVYSILRSFDVPEDKLFSTAKEVEKLNPHLENLNQVEPGTSLFLPQRLQPGQSAQALEQTAEPVPDSRDRVPDTASAETIRTTIQPGDSLVKLLRNKANLPDHLIFDEYLNLFQELNPNVADIDSLEVGQEVVLPVQPGQEGAQAKAQAGAAGQGQPPMDQATKPAQTPDEPISARKANKLATMAILKKVGFRFAPGQELLYPYGTQGWLRVNLEQMPLANTPWGTAVIFIPEPVMPKIDLDEMRAADLKVCRVNDSWEPASTFQSLEDLSRRKIIVWDQGSPMILNIKSQVLELTADIMLIDNSGPGQVTHLFRLNPSRPGTVPPLVHGFLDSLGIQVHTLIQASATRFTPASIPDRTDIYVPTIPATNAWPEIQELLQPRDRTLSLADQNSRSVVQTLKEHGLASRATQRFTFFQSPTLNISLSLPVIQLSTGNSTTFLIEPDQANPFLIAQLNLMGHSCYALTR